MKTFPCIKGKIGDWTYYVTNMRMAELVNYVKFADQLFPRNDLDQIMQRDLTRRSSAITDYLLNNDQRFMGSLIVAAVGGQPKFVPVSFSDESAYSFADGKLGFLRFDGSENYFALDGQHRLAAIKDALIREPEKLAEDEVSLIIIWHKNDDEGKKRARRLFTTVNRYAKKTSKEDDLALDEDNPSDIYTRRLIREHDFFKQRTKVTNLARQGEFRLTKSQSLKPEDEYDRAFLFALLTMKRCNDILLRQWYFDENIKPQTLPEFDVLEAGYNLLVGRWKLLIDNITPWRYLAENPDSTLDLYRKKNGGHPLVRPIAIIAFLDAAGKLLDSQGNVENIRKVSGYFSDLTHFPLKGLLWKEDKGGMYDGQARRKAAASLFGYYLNDDPEKAVVIHQWENASGREIPEDLPSRAEIII